TRRGPDRADRSRIRPPMSWARGSGGRSRGLASAPDDDRPGGEIAEPLPMLREGDQQDADEIGEEAIDDLQQIADESTPESAGPQVDADNADSGQPLARGQPPAAFTDAEHHQQEQRPYGGGSQGSDHRVEGSQSVGEVTEAAE